MKVLTAQEAVALIKNGAAVGIGGFGGWSGPDVLMREMARQFDETNSPRDLTIVAGVAPGDLKEDGWGLSALRAPGIIDTIIAAHIGMPPAIGSAVGTNQIAGYTIPLGVYGHLLRAMAGNKPGVLTHVGLHTFADPRQEGCRANQRAKDQGREIVALVQVDGREYLFYKTFPIDICLLRATYADEDGNISAEEEALISEQLEMATAVHNQGGIVIVQVRDIVQRGSLHARNVLIHHKFVDYVVKADPAEHPQGYDFPDWFRPQLNGGLRVPASALPIMPLTPRKVIGRRGAMELTAGALINLGIGMPDGVASVANEEGLAAQTTLAIEGGTIGGVPVGGVGLGACANPEAIYHITDNFDMYDGGGLDMAFLGLAELDAAGNVNVSKFGTRCTGPGGFINISQNTKKICFMGTFTAGKMDVRVEDGQLHIYRDGSGIKFRKQVQQVTFSARYAMETGQTVLYITDRAVFVLTEHGLLLTEIAPGVDLQRDILDKMEFAPMIASELKRMDPRLFRAEKMGLHF